MTARLERLHASFDAEPFGGWLTRHGSLDRLSVLHGTYESDAEFLQALCGLCMWVPMDYIGDSSVLSLDETTIIGSCVSNSCGPPRDAH